VRRRTPARRARPCTPVKATPAADGRAVGLARRGPQGRDPTLPGAAARRRYSDGLCEPRRGRTAPARDADRDAQERSRNRARRRQGADVAAAFNRSAPYGFWWWHWEQPPRLCV